jgi:Ca2+-binding RTX toxin-like protein
MNAAAGTGVTLSGSVTVNGTSFSTLSAGGQGNDTLTGTAGADWINGDSGADSINGAAGNDYIIGGVGGDTIIGGTGVDTMVGGQGSDVYVTGQVGDSAAATATTLSGTISAGQTLTFGTGVDYITDFNRAIGQDKLDVATAGVLATNLFGTNSATALANNTSYVLYGSWSSGLFTVASSWSGTNNDALVVVGNGSLTASSTTGYVLLENLLGSLQAGNFI